MGTEQVSVKSHYRTLHSGKVVYVHDYHAGHEVSHKSRAAHFHERTAMGKREGGASYLRATDEADAKHIRAAATELRISSSEETRGANHHGNEGRFSHFDFASPGDAALVMQLAGHKAMPQEEPIPKEVGSHDEQFAQIFGDVSLPDEVSQPEWDSQFGAIFGEIEIPEVGMRRKAMIHPHTRTVNGKIVQVKGYEVARAAAQIPGEAHQVGLGLNSPWQGKAMKARDASQAACYASHADDHHAAAEAHDKAADAHDRVGHDKSDSIAARHREIAADHRVLADATPALNRDDNMTAPEKEVIHPKTDMVD